MVALGQAKIKWYTMLITKHGSVARLCTVHHAYSTSCTVHQDTVQYIDNDVIIMRTDIFSQGYFKIIGISGSLEMDV